MCSLCELQLYTKVGVCLLLDKHRCVFDQNTCKLDKNEDIHQKHVYYCHLGEKNVNMISSPDIKSRYPVI